MYKIGLISCVKTKQKTKQKASDLYISLLFKKSFLYCTDHYDKVFILSAKYGLLSPETVICPYNETLNNFNKKQKQKWSYDVLMDLKKVTDIKKDIFYIHAGINYRQYIIKKLINYKIPLNKLRLGNQLKWYNEKALCIR